MQDIDLKKKLEEAKKAADKKEQAKAAQNDGLADDTGNGSATTDNSELTTVKQELEQMTELAKRTMADLQNVRRRQEEERRNIIIMANAGLVSDILPVLDNLERARQHLPESLKDHTEENSNKEWFAGIEMSINQLHQVLGAAGLKPIECLGQKFNPDLHEALVHSPGEKDMIIEELEKGYMLGDRVVRHSKVKVGNGENETNTENSVEST